MTNRFKTIHKKIIGSVLVPVFLFLYQPQATVNASNEFEVTFQVSNSADAQKILSKYNFSSEYLFENTFKATVSERIYNDLQQDSAIAYVELEKKVTAFAVTNDPFFTSDPNAEDRQWYLKKTKVPEAWEYTKGSENVIVAVVDTGIHAGHIELNDGRIIEGYDAVNDKLIPAQSNSDDNGHGTAVAGVIGAIPNNSKGITGVNWKVKIMPVKALSADGTGELSNVAQGIVWAADHGANIINLSLGGNGFGSDQTLSNAITYAYDKGVLIIAAAGNDLANFGTNLDSSPVYPVCGDNGKDMVLGVAATDVNDLKASFSNFGASCIDISAPGKKIITTAYLPSDPSDSVLIYGSGTSLAAPIVSGIAALLKANNPNLSNTDIRNLIKRTADNIYPQNQTACLGGSCNGFLGKGRINALAALTPIPVTEGSLIREVITGDIYLISGNTKRKVSNFVFEQRHFDFVDVLSEAGGILSTFTAGPPLLPLEGTLIKSPNDPQVYVIDSELKRPLTYLVFISRGYNFANVKIIDQLEVNSYPRGEWYWPPDGTMVLISGNPTVYVMDQKVVRPVTLFVFQQRQLSFSKVIKVTVDEFSHIPKPADLYWLPPLNGTLIKSAESPAIYIMENGFKRLLSYEAFTGRNYKFTNVKVLPQVEMNVIAEGLPLLTP